VSLADALERAASALPRAADAIRPANGDPDRLLDALDAERAASVLRWLLSQDLGAAGELAAAWAERDEGAPVFASLDDSQLGKPARKVLRRARHRLRSRGLAVAEPAPSARVARLPGAAEEPVETALVSSIDPSGARIVTLIEPHPGGGARLFQAVIDLRRGVLECRVFATTRGKARRFAREATGREPFPATAVPAGAARALLARAAARQAPDRPLPRGFSEWRSHLAAEGATPGDLVREALGSDAPPRRAAELVRAGGIGPWLPAGEALQGVAEKLQDVQKGKIIVSGGRKRDQVEEILAEARATLFGPEETGRAAEWLAETAYLLWQAGREDDARACLAAAGQQEEVQRALLETALAPVLARLREEEETSLVVRP